jgi:hypothetical protein
MAPSLRVPTPHCSGSPGPQASRSWQPPRALDELSHGTQVLLERSKWVAYRHDLSSRRAPAGNHALCVDLLLGRVDYTDREGRRAIVGVREPGAPEARSE